MKKNDLVKICGELKMNSELIITICDVEYKTSIDSNGEFEIEVDQDHFAQGFTKLDITLMSLAMGAILGYSIYQIDSFMTDIRFSFVYFN